MKAVALVLWMAPALMVCTHGAAQVPGIEARAQAADQALADILRSIGVRPVEWGAMPGTATHTPALPIAQRERIIVTLPVFAAPPSAPGGPSGWRFDAPPSAGGGMPGNPAGSKR